ncbi:sulfite exporter TauE/SafE family protein [Methylobacterium sp. C25]|uniref:TSUP family transporter n=1 Tax=Methylobacterium sp. C25 TaxID=2721622 RepID=UPI001F33E7D5|nr:sulfite exporter TauE/SafE family protein [Methylobacterium sp. C25]MCE4226927.1 sulfite exporter TauE/SafE family protein [Methylobacterium sp. C25]
MIETLVVAACLGGAGFISGLTGFAFSLIASGILLTIKPPIEAAALVLICSILSNVIAIVRLKTAPPWPTALAMILPGFLGAPIGIVLLHELRPTAIKIAIGVFLIAYASFLACLRPDFHVKVRGLWVDGAVGFVGGILGGIAGLSGALPTAWSMVRDWEPRIQRAVYQSFTLVMQIWSLAILALYDPFPPELVDDLKVGIPVVLVSVLLGLALFSRINQKIFRSVVLALLAVLGLTTTVLALPGLAH